MIRFGAIVAVVAVAIGLLAAGAVSGTLTLVYLAIGLAALALLMLIVGVAIWRENLFGQAAAPAEARRWLAGGSGREPEAGVATRGEAVSGRGQPSGDQRSADQFPTASYGSGAARPGPEDAQLSGSMKAGEPGRPADVDGGRPAGADAGRPPGDREKSPSGSASKRQARRDAPTDWSGSVPPPAAAGGRGPTHQDAPRAPSVVGTAPPPSASAARSAATGTMPGSTGPGSTGPGSAGQGGTGSRDAARVAGSAGTAPARTGSVEPQRSGRGGAQQQAGFTWSPETLSASDEREQASVPPPARGGAPTTAPSSVFDVTAARQSSEQDRPDAQPGDKRAPDDAAAGRPPAAAGNGPAAASAAAAAGRVAAAPGRDAPATPGPTAQTAAGRQPADPDTRAANRAQAPAPAPAGARSGQSAGGARSGSSAGGPANGGDPAGAGSATGSAGPPVTARVSVVPGIARYHTAECILIRFLGDEDLQTMSRQEAEAAGNVPCRACKPDKLPTGA
ncbi:MAG TPA: hypothetical protein VGI58_16380 [Streptosporangiaceae bacterium]